METQQRSNTNGTKSRERRFRNGPALGGVIVIIVGTLWLAKEVGADFPHWFFSWPMFLIALGLYIGVRHHFRNPGFLIPIAIGSAFLVDRIVPEVHLRQYLWPAIIIGVGLVMILRSRRRAENDDLFIKLDYGIDNSNKGDGLFESVTIFGENKKQVLSKDFKGGESVCVFGGTEINLMQADISGRVPLELVQVFGGTKLIVPAHWKIETEEIVTIFGGLNDKRQQFQNTVTDDTKVLVLRGTSIFGGIDIKSF